MSHLAGALKNVQYTVIQIILSIWKMILLTRGAFVNSKFGKCFQRFLMHIFAREGNFKVMDETKIYCMTLVVVERQWSATCGSL